MKNYMKKIKKQFGKYMYFIAFVIIVVLLAYFVRWFFFHSASRRLMKRNGNF